jgi:hypothetical protein
MSKTITINYPGGAYGSFLLAFLNRSFTEESWKSKLGDFHTFKDIDDIKFIRSHNDILPTDEFNIKITYDIDDIDLIFRLLWSKALWEIEEQVKNIETRYTNVDVETKKIVMCCFYKKKLHKQCLYWNRETDNTLKIPFKYFLLPLEDYLTKWSHIFESLNLEYDNQYIKETWHKFQEYQKRFIKDLEFNLQADWHQKDWIGKSNLLADLLMTKENKDPSLDKPRYISSSDMLVDWVYKLNVNNGKTESL